MREVQSCETPRSRKTHAEHMSSLFALEENNRRMHLKMRSGRGSGLTTPTTSSMVKRRTKYTTGKWRERATREDRIRISDSVVEIRNESELERDPLSEEKADSERYQAQEQELLALRAHLLREERALELEKQRTLEAELLQQQQSKLSPQSIGISQRMEWLACELELQRRENERMRSCMRSYAQKYGDCKQNSSPQARTRGYDGLSNGDYRAGLSNGDNRSGLSNGDNRSGLSNGDNRSGLSSGDNRAGLKVETQYSQDKGVYLKDQCMRDAKRGFDDDSPCEFKVAPRFQDSIYEEHDLGRREHYSPDFESPERWQATREVQTEKRDPAEANVLDRSLRVCETLFHIPNTLSPESTGAPIEHLPHNYRAASNPTPLVYNSDNVQGTMTMPVFQPPTSDEQAASVAETKTSSLRSESSASGQTSPAGVVVYMPKAHSSAGSTVSTQESSGAKEEAEQSRTKPNIGPFNLHPRIHMPTLRSACSTPQSSQREICSTKYPNFAGRGTNTLSQAPRTASQSILSPAIMRGVGHPTFSACATTPLTTRAMTPTMKPRLVSMLTPLLTTRELRTATPRTRLQPYTVA